jgi:hypothetical protein
MIASFLPVHAYEFFFQPGGGAQWYTGNVYGNLVAIVPTGILLWLYLRSRHLAVLEAHEALRVAHVSHAEKLDKLLDRFDPATDGGIAEVHKAIAGVRDQLDVDTPGGLHEIAARLDLIAKPKE